MEVEMEMDDDDTEPPAPGTEEDAGTRAAVPPGTAVTNVRGTLQAPSVFLVVIFLCGCVFHTLFMFFKILLFINCAAFGGVGRLRKGPETREVRAAEQSYHWQQPHPLHSVRCQRR